MRRAALHCSASRGGPRGGLHALHHRINIERGIEAGALQRGGRGQCGSVHIRACSACSACWRLVAPREREMSCGCSQPRLGGWSWVAEGGSVEQASMRADETKYRGGRAVGSGQVRGRGCSRSAAEGDAPGTAPSRPPAANPFPGGAMRDLGGGRAGSRPSSGGGLAGRPAPPGPPGPTAASRAASAAHAKRKTRDTLCKHSAAGRDRRARNARVHAEAEVTCPRSGCRVPCGRSPGERVGPCTGN